jgi:Cd2+/Zn2+-exporting ATPase
MTTPDSPVLRHFAVDGMDCAEEVATLRDALRSLLPPDEVGFDLLNGRISVPARIPTSQVVTAVAATGMRAVPWVERDAPDRSRRRLSGRAWLVLASGLATGTGFLIHAWFAGLGAATGTDTPTGMPWLARGAYGAAVAVGMWVVVPKAWYALRRLRPDMNLLMTIAVSGAIAIGEWFEAATVAFLFALSLALEGWSVGRARRAVAALMKLAPDRVRIVTEDTAEVVVDPGEVEPGSRFRVRPGERIGLDGSIVRGATEVDEAPITGESLPVPKEVGSTVFAGTINGSGVIDVVSTRPAGETTLARIVRQVGEAQAQRSVAEQWVERFARIYTPSILALALAVAVLPPVLGHEWSDCLYRALVLLVIGCPCALVIATPVAVVASLAAAARHGVLLKSGRVVEVPSRLEVVALDKTGTVTEGRPRVVGIVPLADHDEPALLARAAALAADSLHPIAQAVLAHARAAGVPVRAATDVVAIQGKGVEGRIDGRRFWLGSHRFLEERGQETAEEHQRLEELARTGRTIVVVGNDAHVCGFVAVADRVRTESAAAIAALKRLGISRVVLLSGDNRRTAEIVGEETGVDEVHAELLPEDKVRVVTEIETEFGPTAMVGDGVNDAPALARASMGVAMGAAGTDAAIETADVALMGDDLGKLPWLIEHSRATLTVIRANAILALGIKAVFVLLTFSGMASLWGAIVADMGASLLVVANAMRLLRR